MIRALEVCFYDDRVIKDVRDGWMAANEASNNAFKGQAISAKEAGTADVKCRLPRVDEAISAARAMVNEEEEVAIEFCKLIHGTSRVAEDSPSPTEVAVERQRGNRHEGPVPGQRRRPHHPLPLGPRPRAAQGARLPERWLRSLAPGP